MKILIPDQRADNCGLKEMLALSLLNERCLTRGNSCKISLIRNTNLTPHKNFNIPVLMSYSALSALFFSSIFAVSPSSRSFPLVHLPIFSQELIEFSFVSYVVRTFFRFIIQDNVCKSLLLDALEGIFTLFYHTYILLCTFFYLILFTLRYFHFFFFLLSF